MFSACHSLSLRLLGTGTGSSIFSFLFSMSLVSISFVLFFLSPRGRITDYARFFFFFDIGPEENHTVRHSVNVNLYIPGGLSGSFVGILFHVS